MVLEKEITDVLAEGPVGFDELVNRTFGLPCNHYHWNSPLPRAVMTSLSQLRAQGKVEYSAESCCYHLVGRV